MQRLDDIDRAILRHLQKNGRLSNTELAGRVGLSESASLRRVRILEEKGVISDYVMLVNQASVGKPGNVFVQVTLESQKQEMLEAFERAVEQVSEVMECYLMSGDQDYLLRVAVKDTEEYERIHMAQLTRLPHVARLRSSFGLRTVVKKTDLPIP